MTTSGDAANMAVHIHDVLNRQLRQRLYESAGDRTKLISALADARTHAAKALTKHQKQQISTQLAEDGLSVHQVLRLLIATNTEHDKYTPLLSVLPQWYARIDAVDAPLAETIHSALLTAQLSVQQDDLERTSISCEEKMTILTSIAETDALFATEIVKHMVDDNENKLFAKEFRKKVINEGESI
jgi:hypothetical protein